jgi:hypothetical protein
MTWDEDRIRARGPGHAAPQPGVDDRDRTARVPGKQSGTSHLPHGPNGPYASQEAARHSPGDFDLYLAKHEIDINQVVSGHLADTAWPDPAPDVPWLGVGDRMFAHNLSLLIRPQLRTGDLVQALVHPGDVLARFYHYAGEPVSMPGHRLSRRRSLSSSNARQCSRSRGASARSIGPRSRGRRRRRARMI